MVHPHPLEHLEEHVHVPSHWGITHSEAPFVPTKMHPTKLHFNDATNEKVVEWSSRRHRKGRNLIIRHTATGERIRETHEGKKFWAWEFKNLSWWVAQCFLWGSIAWVINGFAVWLQPFANTTAGDDIARISALVGGAIFLVGASLAYLEALNVHPRADKYVPLFYHGMHLQAKKNAKSSNQTPDNNEANSSPPHSPASTVSPPLSTPQNVQASDTESIEEPVKAGTPPIASPPTLSQEEPDSPQIRPHDSHNPDTSRRSSSLDTASSLNESETPDRVPTPSPPSSPKPGTSQKEGEEPGDKKKFKVAGSRWRELGYIAAVSQICGATIFFISVVTGMHNVIDEDNVGQVQGLYWTPQVIGGMGFVISSTLYMYEVQPSWWQLRPLNIGWQIGFWNGLGAIGFTLCGIFGYYAFDDWGQEWGTAFSTFWGGWAFLIGSYIQLLEAINK